MARFSLDNNIVFEEEGDGDEGLDTALLRAIQEGDPDKLRNCLASSSFSGADFKVVDRNGYNYLHHACMSAKVNLDIVRCLLTGGKSVGEGIDINSETAIERSTPLHLAVENNHLELVKLLIDSGATVNCRDSNQCIPLHVASSQLYVEVAKVLVTAGAELEARDDMGNGTPIMLAINGSLSKEIAGNQMAEMVEVLIEGGADVSPEGYDGDILHTCMKFGYIKVAEMIISARSFNKSKLEAKTNDGLRFTPFLMAAYSLRADECNLLAAHGANVLAKGIGEKSALHLACEVIIGTGSTGVDKVKVVRRLIELGIPVNVCDSKNWTPLHIACQARHIELARYLLDCGADVKRHDNSGVFPLHAACGRDHPSGNEASLEDILKLLIERGADVNRKTVRGFTALHVICADMEAMGTINCFRLLLEVGAHPDERDQEGRTALHHLVRLNGTGRGSLSRSFSGSFSSDLSDDPNGMCSLFPQAVDMLADYGADLDIQDAKGRTALFIAAQKNDEAIVKALLGREARADIPDEYGNLPLDVSSNTRVRKCLRDYMDARQAEKFIPKLK